MEFVNHTPFPAQAFEGIDQHGQAFHAVVLRQTLTFASGQLQYADAQEPLCEQDTYFGAMNESSLRQESDLCQYKPRCDVIVNATACAPEGKAKARFAVRLRVTQPDTAGTAAPERPQGLNPFMAPSQKDLQAWRLQTQQAQSAVTPGACLIDKTLNVTGPRQFKKLFWPVPWITTALQWCSLGLIRISCWRLTAPKAVTQVPLIAENAYGGQCRINAGDKAARRIPKKHRLSPEQQTSHSSAEQPAAVQAAAHSAVQANPIGTGFASQWYVNAAKPKQVKAPQIEHTERPLRLAHFKRALRGKLQPTEASALVAGLGIRAKGHPQRAELCGTIDKSFIESAAWLPQDFDFAVWNAAWPDQQCAYLQNDETIELTNLCAPATPGSTRDGKGHTVLRLQLLCHECFALVRMQSGEMAIQSMELDTAIIEPDSQTLSLVWRLILIKERDAPIRVTEARMRSHGDRQQLQREMALMTQVTDKARQAHQATLAMQSVPRTRESIHEVETP